MSSAKMRFLGVVGTTSCLTGIPWAPVQSYFISR
jgi:hypothetical protein